MPFSNIYSQYQLKMAIIKIVIFNDDEIFSNAIQLPKLIYEVDFSKITFYTSDRWEREYLNLKRDWNE